MTQLVGFTHGKPTNGHVYEGQYVMWMSAAGGEHMMLWDARQSVLDLRSLHRWCEGDGVLSM